MNLSRKLPVGIQDFEKLREENYIYVDKTDLLYKMVHSGNGYFLCRPRYFGKTLLVSAMEAYFRGRRDLFEGLKIEALEEDWQEYVVLRMDFSTDVYTLEGSLEVALETFLAEWEHRYGRHEERTTYAKRFEYIIRRAYETSGKPVVVLIDSYDKPVLDAMFTEREAHNRDMLRNLYSVLNGNDYYLKFVFMTGITKFASVNIFNGSNQLKDISLSDEYGSLCGITGSELREIFDGELSAMADVFNGDSDAKENSPAEGNAGEEENEVLDKTNGKPGFFDSSVIAQVLESQYGGYCFCRRGERVLNPFSLMNALESAELEGYWSRTGDPSMLVKMLQGNGYDMFNIMDGLEVDSSDLMEYRWTDSDLISLIYQTGYVSIAGYDGSNRLFTLKMPNDEIRAAMLRSILSYFTVIGSTSSFGHDMAVMRSALENGDVAAFVNAFAAALPPIEEIKRRKEKTEYAYRVAFGALVRMTGFDVTSDATHGNVVVTAGNRVYAFGMKMDRSLLPEDVEADVLARLDEKGYAGLYGEGKEFRKVALVFSSVKGGVSGWKSE